MAVDLDFGLWPFDIFMRVMSRAGLLLLARCRLPVWNRLFRCIEVYGCFRCARGGIDYISLVCLVPPPPAKIIKQSKAKSNLKLELKINLGLEWKAACSDHVPKSSLDLERGAIRYCCSEKQGCAAIRSNHNHLPSCPDDKIRCAVFSFKSLRLQVRCSDEE